MSHTTGLPFPASEASAQPYLSNPKVFTIRRQQDMSIKMWACTSAGRRRLYVDGVLAAQLDGKSALPDGDAHAFRRRRPAGGVSAAWALKLLSYLVVAAPHFVTPGAVPLPLQTP